MSPANTGNGTPESDYSRPTVRGKGLRTGYTTGSCAAENPLTPIGMNAAPNANPSMVHAAVSAVGITTFTKLLTAAWVVTR